tara:strand:- start:601 stop:816 length:216 start_codon:yes stop_codon:yes gene_type:complete
MYKDKYQVSGTITTKKILYQEVVADSKEEAIKIALKNGYQWDTDDLCTEESGLEEITAQHIDTIWEEDEEY